VQQIKLLPPAVASQIAAGEIIERPAALLKELLENSLDANANSIGIVIQEAGKQLVKVFDNGMGISKADIPLALTQHATSKIAVIEDLVRIMTLGFRGEALASIAAVTDFTLISRVKNADSGWKLESNNKLSPCAHPVGTTILAKNLFLNIPARKKFLRTNKTESIRNDEVIKGCILSNFVVDFDVTVDDKRKHYPSCKNDYQKSLRIKTILGEKFIANSYHFNIEDKGMRLSGWLSCKSYSLRNTEQQYFFVNGRHVKDKLLNHAVRVAFGNFLQAHDYPAYVLYLEIDPQFVDVNVHPTKAEVRFQQAQLVHYFVTNSIIEVLEKDDTIDAKANSTTSSSISSNSSMGTTTPRLPREQESEQHTATDISRFANLFTADNCYTGDINGVVAKRWILVEQAKELLVIDAQTANYHFIYEKLSRAHQKDGITPKNLAYATNIVVPTALEVTETVLNKLQDIGFNCTFSSATTILLRALPAECVKCCHTSLIIALCQHFTDNECTDILTKALKILASHASKLPISGKEEIMACVREVFCRQNTPIYSKATKVIPSTDFPQIFS